MIQTVKRCVNLDWLEVDALEPVQGLDPEYFRGLGFSVDVREYGTRVFAQMFTILDADGFPWIEIRRQPKTTVLSPQDVHIRLTNRTCYYDDAAKQMQDFISRHNYWFQRISRVDICLDFELFDSGDDPKKFILRYLSGKYSKINQSNITGHGRDQWTGRDWNSLSWGSPTSDIGTKMYDKTLELYDETTHCYKKPYIRQAWQACGLIDDWQRCTKTATDGSVCNPRIWRVEFSIRSNVKNWFLIHRDGKAKNKQSIRNTLDMYDGRDKLLVLFASLAQHYFRFKHYDPNQRKDRCEDKTLFNWQAQEYTYKVAKLMGDEKPSRPLSTLLTKIKAYRETHFDKDTRDACNILIRTITDEEQRIEAGRHFTREELQALRLALAIKLEDKDADATILMRQIKCLLKINDKTAPFIDDGKAVQ